MKVANKFRRTDRNDERGVTMVLVAVAMVAIIAMAAMSIDLVTLYLAREEAQRAADASALAAARLISVSGVTSTGSGFWSSMCGGLTGWATQAALAVSFQNTIGGQQTNATVTYSNGTTSGASDCSTLLPAFAVNPMVTVQVTPVSIPSFFSRIWGSTSNSVSATATAEVFNPSNSANNGVLPNGFVTPVYPKCVKPWIVPNLDPGNGNSPLVNPASGQIGNAGVSTNGTGASGIVGEQMTLAADCQQPGATCVFLPGPPTHNPPTATVGNAGTPFSNRLEYVPGSVISPIAAIPSCASAGTNYEKAVAGCDQTVYECGQAVAVNTVDLSENPGGPNGDTAAGLSCVLTNSPGPTIPLDGQDSLISTTFPFVAVAGTANPLNIPRSPLVNSNSIMSLPIYNNATLNTTGTTNVIIVGFLQVFVNDLSPNGDPEVTVINVAGCGNNATNTPLTTNSPVPVRLITPPQ
ncbi:MAG TPA: pilus assembly protein TadG-related protein [Candidatus Eisenbacteria bacterium]|nr:pilus assembly protein TadG-related protein [Candidatus Eisenbacteria bacterium]